MKEQGEPGNRNERQRQTPFLMDRFGAEGDIIAASIVPIAVRFGASLLCRPVLRSISATATEGGSSPDLSGLRRPEVRGGNVDPIKRPSGERRGGCPPCSHSW